MNWCRVGGRGLAAGTGGRRAGAAGGAPVRWAAVRSAGVAERTLARLDLATFSLNPALSRVSTSLLNLLGFAGLHRFPVITWTWGW